MGDQSTPAREGQTSPVCPYCGGDAGPGRSCLNCRGPFDPDSLEATRADLGPWQVRDEARPYLPGCSTARLRAMIQRGAVRPHTPIRRDGGLWRAAARTTGVAPFLGLCPQCQGQVTETMDTCSACRAPLWTEGEPLGGAEGVRTRSGLRALASALAVLFLALALIGGGFAFGMLYQLRSSGSPASGLAFSNQTAPPPIEAPDPSPGTNADTLPVPAPTPSAPPPTAEPFDEVLAAIDAGAFDRAGELIASLAADPELAPQAAAWADLLARQRRIRESATMP